jgi:hypothetical protein
MPFTLSHVAAVLPLRRLCGPDLFAALAIGSMTPDLPYFLPGLRESWPLPSHDLISLPLFCLPVGWLLWMLWRPFWTSTGLADHDTAPSPPAPPLWRTMAALAVGALTHLAWDACTHPFYGLGRWFPALGHPVFRIGNAAISSANLWSFRPSADRGVVPVDLAISSVQSHPLERSASLKRQATHAAIAQIQISLMETLGRIDHSRFFRSRSSRATDRGKPKLFVRHPR